MKRWIGIDVGANGAIAMIAEDGTVEIYELNDDILIAACKEWGFDECVCCVEQVSSSPQMGVKSAFSFGEGFGGIKMCLKCNGIPFETVRPQKWKTEFGANISRSSPLKEKKAKDIEVCKRLYPNVSLKRTPKCRTDDDNFADALLMATYAKRKF